jgi:hypothetical protein
LDFNRRVRRSRVRRCKEFDAMRRFRNLLLAATFAGSALTMPAVDMAVAAPLSVAPASVVQGGQMVEQIKYRPKRRVVRRHARGPNPAAVLGVFGAVVGAAIANSRRDDDYYDGGGYAPGYYTPQPDYYDAPAYGYGGPVYRGGGHRNGYREGYIGPRNTQQQFYRGGQNIRSPGAPQGRFQQAPRAAAAPRAAPQSRVVGPQNGPINR